MLFDPSGFDPQRQLVEVRPVGADLLAQARVRLGGEVVVHPQRLAAAAVHARLERQRVGAVGHVLGAQRGVVAVALEVVDDARPERGSRPEDDGRVVGQHLGAVDDHVDRERLGAVVQLRRPGWPTAPTTTGRRPGESSTVVPSPVVTETRRRRRPGP